VAPDPNTNHLGGEDANGNAAGYLYDAENRNHPGGQQQWYSIRLRRPEQAYLELAGDVGHAQQPQRVHGVLLHGGGPNGGDDGPSAGKNPLWYPGSKSNMKRLAQINHRLDCAAKYGQDHSLAALPSPGSQTTFLGWQRYF